MKLNKRGRLQLHEKSNSSSRLAHTPNIPLRVNLSTHQSEIHQTANGIGKVVLWNNSHSNTYEQNHICLSSKHMPTPKDKLEMTHSVERLYYEQRTCRFHNTVEKRDMCLMFYSIYVPLCLYSLVPIFHCVYVPLCLYSTVCNPNPSPCLTHILVHHV